MDDLRVISPPGKADDDAALAGGDGSSWWLASLFGAIASAAVRAVRAARRVAPLPGPNAGAPTTSKKGATVPTSLPGATEVGKVLHGSFDFKTARPFEIFIVEDRAMADVSVLRGLTPKQFIDLCQESKMTRAQMNRFREDLAPEDFDERPLHALFAAF